MTPIFGMIIAILIAGALGGVINAVMTENGFVMPRKEVVAQAATVIRPGIIGNVLIGGAAATISWGLYGPLSAYIIIGMGESKVDSSPSAGLTLAALVGAMLVGISGARWLTNEVDKSLLKAAATLAANSGPSPVAAQGIAISSPARALEISRGL